MTIDRASQRALAAAKAGDLEGVAEALRARAAAIALLQKAPPSEELQAQIRRAIEAGEEIGEGLDALKVRLGLESARLGQLQSGLMAGFGSMSRARIDYLL